MHHKSQKTSARSTAIKILHVGESVTFTQPLELTDQSAASKLSMSIGSYCTRRCPGASFSYETFTTLTNRQRPIVGVIVTRLSGGAQTPREALAPRQNRCKKCGGLGHYAKTCPA
jgi:hypothetical protein